MDSLRSRIYVGTANNIFICDRDLNRIGISGTYAYLTKIAMDKSGNVYAGDQKATYSINSNGSIRASFGDDEDATNQGGVVFDNDNGWLYVSKKTKILRLDIEWIILG